MIGLFFVISVHSNVTVKSHKLRHSDAFWIVKKLVTKVVTVVHDWIIRNANVLVDRFVRKSLIEWSFVLDAFLSIFNPVDIFFLVTNFQISVTKTNLFICQSLLNNKLISNRFFSFFLSRFWLFKKKKRILIVSSVLSVSGQVTYTYMYFSSLMPRPVTDLYRSRRQQWSFN